MWITDDTWMKIEERRKLHSDIDKAKTRLQKQNTAKRYGDKDHDRSRQLAEKTTRELTSTSQRQTQRKPREKETLGDSTRQESSTEECQTK